MEKPQQDKPFWLIEVLIALLVQLICHDISLVEIIFKLEKYKSEDVLQKVNQ